MSWDRIAEARIREWLARPAEERAAAPPPADPAAPLEVQLFQDVLVLDQMAAADPENADALRARASDLMVRVMVLLESAGRPLAARAFAEQRRAALPPVPQPDSGETAG